MQMVYGAQQPQLPQQGMFPNQPLQPQQQQQPLQAQQQQWYPNQPAPHPQQYPPYGSQMAPNQVPGPRYDRPGGPPGLQSKQALTQMLRMRLPSSQFMAGQQQQQQQQPQGVLPNTGPNVPGPTAFPAMQQRTQFIRQQLRATHAQQHGGPPGMTPQQGMFGPPQQQPQQQGMYAGMQQGEIYT